MDLKDKNVIDIKGECIRRRIEIIKTQRELIKLAKANKISYDGFLEIFNNLEKEDETLEGIADICTEMIELYIDLKERLG